MKPIALLILCLCIFTQCKNNSNTNHAQQTHTTTAVENTQKKSVETSSTVLEYTTLPSGIKVAKAENGITVVNPNGWTSAQMDFQQNYCEQSFAKLDEVDGPSFCKCFLEKVQYYYKPIYAKEAYTDQTIWNQYCTQNAIPQ